jgi:lathosterol oxidase
MLKFLHDVFLNWSYFSLWGISFFYFLILYWGLGSLFLWTCKKLEDAGWAERIENQPVAKEQVLWEQKYSFVSIIIFGFSIWPVAWLLRSGIASPAPDTFWTVFSGLILLNIWNEIHFFFVHKLMHVPFFMKNIHKIHHRSRIPTVWSVYSFHWLEALILSTVPAILILFFPIPLLALAMYPVNSILFNFAGHCNYRLAFLRSPQDGLATRHVIHHQKANHNFGFASDLLDKISIWKPNK